MGVVMKNKSQVLGLLGGTLLVLGAFLPVISVPIMGSITYFNNGQGDGIIVAALGILTAGLSFANKFRALFLTGAASLAVIGYSFSNVILKLNDARAKMEDSLQGNPFSGLAEGIMNSIQIQFGWVVLILGVVVTLSSAITSLGKIVQKKENAENES
jgi:hypothetical protein